MPVQLQLAWFHLLICVATAVAYLALLPFVGPARAMAAMGLIGFAGLSPLIFRRRKADGVLHDERDQLIQLRSLSASWAILWLFFVAACMGTWFLRRDGTISTAVLPVFVFVGWFVTMLTQAIAMLVQYRTQGG